MGRRAEDVNDSLPAGLLTPVVVSTSTPFTNQWNVTVSAGTSFARAVNVHSAPRRTTSSSWSGFSSVPAGEVSCGGRFVMLIMTEAPFW